MGRYLEEKKWTFQKVIMLLQFVLTTPALCIMLGLRGWNTLSASDVFSVALAIMGTFICGLMYISSVKDRQDKSLRTACFAYLVSLTAGEMFLDSVIRLIPALPVWRTTLIIVCCLFEVLSVAMICVFWAYLEEVTDSNDPRLRFTAKIIHVLGAVAILSVVGNLFWHYYFYVDAAGTYIQKPTYALFAVYPLLTDCLFILLILRMPVSASQKRVLTTFVTMPVLASILDALTNVSITYPAMLCSLIFIYGNVFAEQESTLAKEQLAAAKTENELLLTKQEQARVETELNMASEIQTHILPIIFPPFPEHKEFDLYATMHAAKEVGGDLYDFFLIDDDHLGLVIADVSGKGVPAALYMMIAKTMIKNAAMQGLSPAAVLEQVNDQLCEGGHDIEMFVTVWYGQLEISSGKLIAANGGHEYPALRHPDGQFELYKDRHGFVLGGMSGMRYKEYELELKPGSTLFVYTDGVPEATDDQGGMYGTGRMLEALNREPDAAADALIRCVLEDVHEFTSGTEQFDDITMLALRMNLPQDERQGKNTVISREKPAVASIPAIQEAVENILQQASVPMKVVTKLDIVIDEVYSNIALYSGAKEASIACSAGDGTVVLTFEDDGIPYDQTQTQAPDVTLSADERKIGGLGVFITRKITDSMEYTRKDGKNVLTLLKNY